MKIIQRPSNNQINVHNNTLINRIYTARGIEHAGELDYGLHNMPNPLLLAGMTTIVDALEAAFDQQKSITIVGDFDADGATSTAVGMLGFKMLGFDRVNYLVPDRFKHGYGLTPEIVRLAKSERNPDIILTVDNGISSFAGVDEAHKLGMTVLVTDHHLPGESLPNADAIVNPNLPGHAFPSKSMAGVGVMFCVLGALKMRLQKHKKLPKPVNLVQLLDLVALGTVADLVPLDYVNRLFVQTGLSRIKSQRGRPGINALLSISGRDITQANTADFGFSVGPRLNAAGRMDDMSIGIECLMAETTEKAFELAKQLNDFNVARKAVEADMKSDALDQLGDMDLSADDKYGLCLYNQDWHQGVIGILASRIKDIAYKPVIAFAPDADGYIKGSARSIPGLHIRDALSNVAKDAPEILSKFGGHAMAAGLSIKESDLPVFTQLFNNEIRRLSDGVDLTQTLLTDGELQDSEFNVQTAEMLGQAGPFGMAFPEPCFQGVFAVVEAKVLKDKHLKLKLRSPAGKWVDAIKFNLDNAHDYLSRSTLNCVFKLSINEFRGERSVQLMLDYID